MNRLATVHTTRPQVLRRVASRVLAVAAIVGVTMLGNLRLQASEVTKASPREPATRVPVSWVADDPHGYTSEALVASADGRRIDPQVAAMSDADGVGDESDGVQLVPAIYAWNPDVRFVYFRHVSKWM